MARSARLAVRKQLLRFRKPRRTAMRVDLDGLMKEYGVPSTLSEQQRAACDAVGLEMRLNSDNIRTPFSVNNMNEFFTSKFGSAIKEKVNKTTQRYQGQPIYEVTSKIEHYGLKKGYKFYLDGLHKDHIEVFNSKGKAKMVLNLDGTLNEQKTSIALSENRRI